MKKLIEDSEKTELMAEEILTELTETKENLTEAQGKIEVLSVRNDTLEQKLDAAKIEIDSLVNKAVAIIDIQKNLSKINDTTAIIYDQTCAAEKRRRIKNSLLPEANKKIFIKYYTIFTSLN